MLSSNIHWPHRIQSYDNISPWLSRVSETGALIRGKGVKKGRYMYWETSFYLDVSQLSLVPSFSIFSILNSYFILSLRSHENILLHHPLIIKHESVSRLLGKWGFIRGEDAQSRGKRAGQLWEALCSDSRSLWLSFHWFFLRSYKDNSVLFLSLSLIMTVTLRK